MHKLLFFTLCMSFLVSCDAPMRTRTTPVAGHGNNMGPGNFNSGSGSGNLDPINTPTNPGNGSTPGTTNPGTGQPGTGLADCDLTDKYHSVDIGHFAICQSSTDETHFMIKTSMAHQSPSAKVCLIPTYKDSTGSSTYIGQPQCTFTTQNQPVSGQLYKNRQGFSAYPLNGVIVMKESLLPEYFACMHAYLNWLPQACPNGPSSSPYCQYWGSMCPYGPKTNQNCDSAARSYMSQVCTTFKNKYGNSYSDIRTRSN